MALSWTKRALNSNLARAIRAGTWKIKPSIDGHTYTYTDLKELWSAGDETHVVCTHDNDPVWQYYHHTPDGGWKLTSVHPTRVEAKAEAENHTAPPAPTPIAPGTYVLARKDENCRWIRTKVETQSPENLKGIFERMGYETQVEVIPEVA